ncbi:MAG: amidohydrolase [Alphaproteobacteria bacterium]|nr:amidohydrolase [Alphaproteobacteria bacterium]
MDRAVPVVLASLLLGGCPKEAAPVTSWWEADEASRQAVEDPPLAHLPAPKDLDLVGATVLTATGARHAPGRVLVRDGRIAWVGDEGEGPDCAACEVVRADGAWVTPGLIDTHSHLGVYPSPHLRAHGDGNEATSPTTPGVWAEGSVWPGDPGFRRAVAGGVTTLQILPGSANLVGGRGVVVRPIPARGGRAMRFPGAPETVKMACGENPKRVYGDGGGPSTRMGNLKVMRETFLRAQGYLEAWAQGDPPERDLDLDTLAGVLEGRFLLQVHCYRSDDMLSFLQLAQEFGFRVRGFHHAIEAYRIRDILAAQEVSVSTWSDWWGFKAEAWDAVLQNAALVAEAGGRAVIHSDDALGIQRLNQEAAKAWHDGLAVGIDLEEDEALRWITANAAWTLGLDDETGSLEAGKRADLVLWDAHPFSVYARAQRVWIDGRLVYDHEVPVAWSDVEPVREVGP